MIYYWKRWKRRNAKERQAITISDKMAEMKKERY